MFKMIARFSCLVLLMLFFGPSWASTAIVDAVQMPAWRLRGNQVEPLFPGQQVQEGDRVRTGSGARAYIRLPEGSTLKLGEQAQLVYQSAAQEDSVFKMALNVANGAFRFTTAAIKRLQKRDVSIRVGNATIGIRGTDVWGRSGKDEDLVMLIEGHVEVQPAQGEATQLVEPLSVFTAAKGGAANPLMKASMEELKARARETDIKAGDGAMRSHGKVKLLLGRFDDEQKALALWDRVRDAGFDARVLPIKAEEGEAATYQYEVAIPGFVSKAEAAVARQRLKQLAGVEADEASAPPPTN